MENAKVVVFEDDANVLQKVRESIDNSSHIITAEAGTLASALDIVKKVAGGEVECDVFILDANLDSRDGNDARALYTEINRQKIAAKIIGFSLNEMRYYGIWKVAADPGKYTPDKIHEVIDRL